MKISNILNFILLAVVSFLLTAAAGAPQIAPVVFVGLYVGAKSVPRMALGFNAFNVPHPANNAGAGSQLRYRVYYAFSDQVDVDNFPARDESNQISDLPLIPGESMHYLDAIPSKVTDNSPSSGDPGMQTFQPVLTMTFAGYDKEIRNFITDNLNAFFYLIYENCESGDKFIFGSKCSPAHLVVTEAGHGQEKTGAVLEFKTNCPVPPLKYIGIIDTGSASGA